MRHRFALLVLVACALTTLDLVQKAAAPVYGHPRGPLFVAGAAVLALAVGVLVPRVPSTSLSVAGGVCAVVGAATLVVGAAAFALTHPALLREPV